MYVADGRLSAAPQKRSVKVSSFGGGALGRGGTAMGMMRVGSARFMLSTEMSVSQARMSEPERTANREFTRGRKVSLDSLKSRFASASPKRASAEEPKNSRGR